MGGHPIYLNYPFIYHIPLEAARLPDCVRGCFFSFRAQRLTGSCSELLDMSPGAMKKTPLEYGFKEKHHDQPANLGGYAIFRPVWKLSLQFAPRDGNVSISRWKLLSFQLICSKIWPTHPPVQALSAPSPAVQRRPNHLGSVAPQNRTGLSNKW